MYEEMEVATILTVTARVKRDKCASGYTIYDLTDICAWRDECGSEKEVTSQLSKAELEAYEKEFIEYLVAKDIQNNETNEYCHEEARGVM